MKEKKKKLVPNTIKLGPQRNNSMTDGETMEISLLFGQNEIDGSKPKTFSVYLNSFVLFQSIFN